MNELVRTPVRITATICPRAFEHLIGHEATAYSGDSDRLAVQILSPVLRLSDEAAALPRSCSGYVPVELVTFESIDVVTETVLL